MNALYKGTEWITRFAYVNILWIGFSLLGLVVFGFFPATVAMFTLVRQWIMGGNIDDPVFSTFWKTYKQEFLKSNVIGLIIMIIAFLFYVNFQYIGMNQGGFHDIIKIPLYLFMFLISLTILYVIPVYVHYDVRFTQIWRNAFFLMLLHPMHNIALVVSIIILLFVMQAIPGLIPFFSGSIIAFLIMGNSYLTFKRVEAKQEKLLEESSKT
ncbi:YesL family protein [Gracilibacillus sp. JCM 18860]|uniref:YesL family protein n=1 Tax=Gracilibacillus sp. JCM 18860 TaxID=1306159 RepID=UPI000A50CB73